MKIGIDVDDTISASCDYFNEIILNDKLGIDRSDLLKKDIYYMQLDKYVSSEEIEEFLDLFEKNFENIPPKENAVKVINNFKKRGHKVYIITARSNRYYKDPYHSTERQLKKYGLKYDRLICNREKGKICKDLGIDLFIDDSHFNIEDVTNKGIKCLLFNDYYNKSILFPYDRVSTWDEVDKIVRKMERKKNKNYFKELIWELNIVFIQLLLFYIFPLLPHGLDHLGVNLTSIFLSFLLSIIFGYKSDLKVKHIYPVGVSLLFIPSVLIFYDASALIHSSWYLFITLIGVAIGSLIKSLVE